MLAHNTGQVQVTWLDCKAQLLVCFATGARIGRLALLDIELATAWAPQPAIRFLRASDKHHFVALIEAREQSRNCVGKIHSCLRAALSLFHQLLPPVCPPPPWPRNLCTSNWLRAA